MTSAPLALPLARWKTVAMTRSPTSSTSSTSTCIHSQVSNHPSNARLTPSGP